MKNVSNDVRVRLKALMDYYGLNYNSFSREIGLRNNTAVGQIMNMEGRYPSFGLLTRILDRFKRINARWLITGEGTMFAEEEDFLPDSRDRVIHIMNKYRHTISQMSIKTNIQASDLEKVVNGERPTGEILKAVCEGYTEINPEWIMKNQGKMYRNGNENKQN